MKARQLSHNREPQQGAACFMTSVQDWCPSPELVPSTLQMRIIARNETWQPMRINMAMTMMVEELKMKMTKTKMMVVVMMLMMIMTMMIVVVVMVMT